MDFLRIVAGVTCAHVASREEALDPGSFDPKELLVALIGYWSGLLLSPSNLLRLHSASEKGLQNRSTRVRAGSTT